MEIIISIFVSVIGCYYGKMDFFDVFTLSSMAISLYTLWIKYTN